MQSFTDVASQLGLLELPRRLSMPVRVIERPAFLSAIEKAPIDPHEAHMPV